MAFIAVPELLGMAATDLTRLGSTIGLASAQAAAPTVRVLAAAEDEVSAAIAQVFSSHGQGFQALGAQAAAFHEEFVKALNAGLGSYVHSEAANVAALTASSAQTLQQDFSGTVGLVMGGSGIPLPNYDIPNYVGLADELYIHPNFPSTTYPNPYLNGLFTPEYAVGSVPFSINYPTAISGILAGFPAEYTSVGQGILILENAISSNLAYGHASTVFGWSQSSIISGLVMQMLDPTGTPMPNSGLQFVLVGDPNAPNGGLLERFVGLQLPSFGLSFDGATPSNSYPTDIYSLEYDGYADFPKYPINFLSDLNAAMGFEEIHGLYLSLTPAQVAQAILLPGSEALGADNLTNYYMIPLDALSNHYLPILQPLANTPLIGKPLADLLQPDLSVLVNLGYGSDNLGYSTPANVPTPFGLFPHVPLSTISQELVTGAHQGMNAFMSDVHSLASQAAVSSGLAQLVSSAPHAAPILKHALAAWAAGSVDPATTVTKFAYAFSTAADILYTSWLPVTDLLNAALTAVPAYDFSLFLANLSNPLDAIGLPIAADVGFFAIASYVSLAILLGGGIDAIAEIASLIP
jgi:PE-PPE domain/PE family